MTQESKGNFRIGNYVLIGVDLVLTILLALFFCLIGITIFFLFFLLFDYVLSIFFEVHSIFYGFFAFLFVFASPILLVSYFLQKRSKSNALSSDSLITANAEKITAVFLKIIVLIMAFGVVSYLVFQNFKDVFESEKQQPKGLETLAHKEEGIAIDTAGIIEDLNEGKYGAKYVKYSESTDKQILIFLKEFYTYYIIENSKMPRNEKSIDKIKTKYCTTSFLNKISYEELDFDPFLNTQDCQTEFLKSLSITKRAGEFNSYMVSYMDEYNKTKITIELTVVIEKGGFKIDSILPNYDQY